MHYPLKYLTYIHRNNVLNLPYIEGWVSILLESVCHLRLEYFRDRRLFLDSPSPRLPLIAFSKIGEGGRLLLDTPYSFFSLSGGKGALLAPPYYYMQGITLLRVCRAPEWANCNCPLGDPLLCGISNFRCVVVGFCILCKLLA